MIVRSGSLLSIAALVLGQSLAFLPLLSPAGIYVPQLLEMHRGPLLVFALGVGVALMVHAPVRLIYPPAARPARWRRTAAQLFIATIFLASFIGGAYYSRFGYYPGLGVLRDLVAAPAAFAGYATSDAQPADVAIVIVAIIAAVAFAVAAAWASHVDTSRVLHPLIAFPAGALLLLGVHAAPLNQQHGFLVSEHSLPAVRAFFSVLAQSSSNRVEVARSVLPMAPLQDENPATSRARHVVLIIAEALRADHLPAYGYERNTTPFLSSDAARWLRFERAYSHGSRTADSFPVIFNSRYFAAIDRSNAGALAFWRQLRDHGVRSAFFSAGALEWGGVTTSVGWDAIDDRLIASDFSSEYRRELAGQTFAYAVDDALPVQRYIGMVKAATGQSFATLHLEGSHYPFNYDDVSDEFFPNLRHTAGRRPGGVVSVQSYDHDTDMGRWRLEEIANSYDNSLRHIDHQIENAMRSLEAQGILEDSVVIVTSDHGESLGDHRTLFHGTTLYEEQVHVPLLIRVGANLAGVRERLALRAGHIVGQVDLLPTIAHLLLGTAPVTPEFEGRSWLAGAPKPYELLLFRGIGEKLAVVTDERKFLFDIVGRRAEEYDLRADPRELENLWPGRESTAAEFLAALRQRLALTAAVGQ